MNKELKPCPFCGGQAIMRKTDSLGRYDSDLWTESTGGVKIDHYIIRCVKCGIHTKPYKTKKGVFNAWNRRVHE